MQKKFIALFLLVILAAQTPAFATQVKKVSSPRTVYAPSTWAEEPEYIDRAFGKMAYGFWNFLTGPFELVKQPYESAVLGDNILVGFARGIFYGVADTAGGFLNFITFPITALKIPLPKGGTEHSEF